MGEVKMTNTELNEQILWFESLRDELAAGKVEDVQKAIDGAIKLLWREKESRVKQLEKV